MDINKSLDYFMKLHRMTQADIAREGGLSPATISLIRNGHREPSCSTLVTLSDLFEVTVSEFIREGEHG
jgi:transcriptional regulator with XRE-family HTH domain|tara:strand:+ start:2317 stop:2523 length:207 start_codon:yes stop_codon:yes gene_type:complete